MSAAVVARLESPSCGATICQSGPLRICCLQRLFKARYPLVGSRESDQEGIQWGFAVVGC